MSGSNTVNVHYDYLVKNKSTGKTVRNKGYFKVTRRSPEEAMKVAKESVQTLKDYYGEDSHWIDESTSE